MAEEVGVEISQVSKKDAPVLSPESNSAKRNSLARGWLNFAKGEPCFEGSHVVEHVARPTVDALVERITGHYSVPQRAVENGLKTEIYIIKNEDFVKFIENLGRALIAKEIKGGIYPEGEGKTKEQSVKEEAELVDGGHWLSKTGRQLVLMKESGFSSRESIEIHELLHAMSVNVGRDNTSGFSLAEGFRGNNIDEAVTEILALHIQYPKLTAEELYGKIYTGEIKHGYSEDIKKMLVILSRTKQNETPFTFKELAKYYFHNIKEGLNPLELMRDDIVSRTIPSVRESTRNWLNNDLEDVSS